MPYGLVVGLGFLGARVLRRMLDLGWEAKGVSRSGAPRSLSASIDRDIAGYCFACDIRSNEQRLAEFCAGASAVVCAVAPGVPRTASAHGIALRRSLYVDGVRHVSLSARGRARVFVHCSSTSASPDVDGVVVETSEGECSDRGRLQRESEEQAQRHGAAWILRLAGLWGPGHDLQEFYRRRGCLASGAGNRWANLVHVDDAAAAVLAAACRHPPMNGRVVHVVDEQRHTRRDVYGPKVRFAERDQPAPFGKRIVSERLGELGVRCARVPAPFDDGEVSS